MRLIRQGEEMPVKGIISSELIVTFKTDLVFEPNTAVNLTISGGKSMTFSEHYISRISRRGSLLTIHAFDRMRRTENPFDDSLYNESDQPYNASLLIADLANQCGFANVYNIPSCFEKFYFRDIHGKKCREILDAVSRFAVGAWYCTNENILNFTPFLSPSCGIAPIAASTSRVYLHSVKGPFRALYAENTSSGDIFSAGSASDFRNILKLSGNLFTEARASDIMSSAAEKSYQAFYCAHIDIPAAPEGLTGFYFDDYPDGLVSCRTVVHFCADSVYAEARAADICEDESDYTDLTGYELRKKIDSYREYGSTVMTDRGIGIVSNAETDDVRERQTYFFSRAADGVTGFDGAILDGIMPSSVESVSETVKKITYGSSIFKLSFDVDENGKKTNIKLEKEAVQ